MTPVISNNNISPGGNFPLNTNGGGLSYCHPGMYSIFTIIEADSVPFIPA